PYKSTTPRYARRVPLIAQGGVAGRFALLAAPSSPRSLALLELKSALFEAITQRFDLPAEPSPDGLLKQLRRAGSLDEGTLSALKEVLSMMQQVEASVVGGRHAHLSRSALARASSVVHHVLATCGADANAPPSPTRHRPLHEDDKATLPLGSSQAP